jgi:predicted house-cleaning noncanonical NTP pyrophosphatase (MazG superfamily)
MSWKIVRDHNEPWCRAHGVSGQWRTSPDPVSALLRKLYEEAGEYAEHWDPAELYDLADVLDRLILLADPDFAALQPGRTVCLWSQAPFGQVTEAVGLYAGSRQPAHLHAAALALTREIVRADPDETARKAHAAKLAQMGGFDQLVEWCPVPDAGQDREGRQ